MVRSRIITFHFYRFFYFTSLALCSGFTQWAYGWRTSLTAQFSFFRKNNDCRLSFSYFLLLIYFLLLFQRSELEVVLEYFISRHSPLGHRLTEMREPL